MLGYVPLEIKINKNDLGNIVLQENTEELNEVLVQVGYGTIVKQDVTGAINTIKMDDLLKAPVHSFDQSLQGRIAGVQITSSDGQPGQDMNIVIRGSNSLTQDNSPLYVVDGFPMEDFSPSTLNPSDIETITILKDASASAIYGSRGANGVVIVETKKGKEGKASITYNGTFGLQQSTKKMKLMSPYEYVLYRIEQKPSNFDKYLLNKNFTFDDYKDFEAFDMQDLVFRDALLHIHNISMQGGTKETKYAASASVSHQDGVIINSSYRRYQGKFSLEQKIGKRINAAINANYSREKTQGQSASAALASTNANSSYLMYRTWGYSPVIQVGEEDQNLFDDEFDGNDSAVMNPWISNSNEYKVSERMESRVDAKITYDIGNGFKALIRGGYRERFLLNEDFNNSQTYGGYKTINNPREVNATYRDRKYSYWMNENTIQYWKRFKRKNVISATAGFTMQENTSSDHGFRTILIPNEELGMSGMEEGILYTASSQKSRNTLVSFLGRANYTFDSRYVLTGTFRADGSSKFRGNNKWGYFPSVAFAWRLKNENFLKNVTLINDTKFRLSYGITGNNRVWDFAAFPSLKVLDYYSIGNGAPQSAIYLSSFGNEDLKWESTEQIDIGYEISLWDSRINLEVDLYNKTTKDLLLYANLPYSSGQTRMFKNIGKVQNRGLEISFRTINYKKNRFIWSSDFNISFNKNKVLALTEGEETYFSMVSFLSSSPLYVAKRNQPMALLFGTQRDGVYSLDDFDIVNGSYLLKATVPTNGSERDQIRPGDVKYVDQNNDGIVNDLDRVIIGNPNPIHTGGFNNNLSYNNFDLNVFFQWSYGNDVYNANRIVFEGNLSEKNINQFASYNDHWTLNNQSSEKFRAGGAGPKGIYSSYYVEDGSFLRLKTVRLAYNFSETLAKRCGLETLQLYIAGQNLWTWTKYSGLDPEVSTNHSALTPGYDYSSYARAQTFTVGVSAQF